MAPRNREDSGYLTSIVRIRLVPLAAAIAIVNTILNSIENLSRLKRKSRGESVYRLNWIKYVTALKAISAFREGRSV